MSPPSAIATREVSEAESPQKPARLTRFPEKEFSQIRTRLDVIGRQPNPGRLARKLRQRKSMSIQDVGSALDVNSDLVDLFEKSGDIRIWTDVATTRLFSDGREHEESGEELLDRFIEFLGCSKEEQGILRHDLCEDVTWMLDLLRDALPEDVWKDFRLPRDIKRGAIRELRSPI